jgi:primosomal protein N' (replication factor Y) (superfamily II helicase)
MPRRRAPKNLINVAVMTAIRGPLTYGVPESMHVRPGQRVVVPLSTRRVLGVALEPVADMAPGVKVREILRVVDPEPILSPELLTLALWIAEYYLAPVGEVFRALLPLRAESNRTRWVQITEKGRKKLEELNASLLDESRGGEEAALLSYLANAAASTDSGAQHSRNGPKGNGASKASGPFSNLPYKALAGASFGAVQRKFSASSPGLIDRAIAAGWISVSEIERERRRTLTVRLAGSAPSAAVQGPIPERPLQLSPVAQRIVETLRQQGSVSDHRELLKAARASLDHLKKLNDAGLLEITPGSPSRERRHSQLELEKEEADDASSGKPALRELTTGQAAVMAELSARLRGEDFGVMLLHGVTASGKTEIYLRLIAQCLERGRTALLLVPEIALTPGVQAQFQARFGDRVAVLHSGLGKAERDEEWRRAWHGDARVVLGTRSAVFAPLPHLGVVIVDEEHESSYKQEETPRYHGRDVAVVRGRLSKALVVLGSATPSLESYWNAQQRKYGLVTLEERVGGRPLAAVEIVDMREEFRQTFTKIPISRRLKAEIEAQLASKAQTMILLNRRGYSWFLLCRACGETQRCVNCSISLTYHRREHRLICHYCGYSTAVPSRCPHCASEYLYYVGEGTEKIEDKLAELFPGTRVARLDRDIARRAGQYQRLLADFRQGKIDILVGTQLIAKGHDFPGVTLVGVVSADHGLALPDFRAAERTFQLLTQAAGRAGRGETPGRVLVQTFYPEHYAIKLAADQNYGGFFSKEMRFRRMMHYPPVTALANVIAQDTTLEKAARVANEIGRFFAAAVGESPAMKILGPTPAPLAKLEGRFRIQFLLKAKSRAQLNALLRRLVDHCEHERIPRRSVMIDVDPVSIM